MLALYQIFVYHHMTMTRFYCYLGSYGKIVEHKCPMSWPWCIAYNLQVAMVCISWLLFLFHFLCKLIMLLQLFSIFKIWVGDLVCKLSVLLWTIALSIGGCLYNFLSNRKSRNKEGEKKWCFCKEKNWENNFWTPLLFPSPSFFICHSFSL